jgi:hypothetical protein
MRMVLFAMLLSFSMGFDCRTDHGEVRPQIVGGMLTFGFGPSGWRTKSPSVNRISVFELDQRQRGRTVCSVNRLTRVGTVELAAWRYGERIEGFDLQGCGPLEIGRNYGVTVSGSYGSGVAFFVLERTGSVRKLGP